MKRLISLLISVITVFSLFGCNSDLEKSDELAVPFVEALLLRDEDAMKEYIHPDYLEEAVPDDTFYQRLEKEHFFKIGNPLTQLTAIEKERVKETELDGDLLKCSYVIVCSELYYDVVLMILDNDNGYGIIAVSMNMNTNPEMYK